MNHPASDEDKFTLEYFPPGEPADGEPLFKYRTFYLDDALAEGWRITRGGGSALRVTRRREQVFGEEELKKVFGRMSELEGGRPGGDERELASLALGEPGA